MFQSSVIIFREIELNDELLFEWFKLCEKDDTQIVPAFILTEQEHWEKLAIE